MSDKLIAHKQYLFRISIELIYTYGLKTKQRIYRGFKLEIYLVLLFWLVPSEKVAATVREVLPGTCRNYEAQHLPHV